MARTQSRTSTAIWSSDADFRNLTESAQRAYWMLYSQGTISLCGVLALTVRRWAQNAKDSTENGILSALKELEDSGYLVVDYDTEEVLVRTFAKHDGVHKNSKTWGPTWLQLANIASPMIREAAEAELWKIGSPPNGIHDGDTPSSSQNQSGNDEGNGASSLSPPIPCLHPLSPSTSPPGIAPGGTGATHGDGGHGLRVRRDLSERVANVCVGKNRRTVITEAVDLVEWALAVVDKRIVEEAVGWAKQQESPPVLPRALAGVILKKAKDSNIALLPFKPAKAS